MTLVSKCVLIRKINTLGGARGNFFYRHRFFNVRLHVENHVFAQVKALMDGGAQGAMQPASHPTVSVWRLLL